jgi:hypothetical protein
MSHFIAILHTSLLVALALALHGCGDTPAHKALCGTACKECQDKMLANLNEVDRYESNFGGWCFRANLSQQDVRSGAVNVNDILKRVVDAQGQESLTNEQIEQVFEVVNGVLQNASQRLEATLKKMRDNNEYAIHPSATYCQLHGKHCPPIASFVDGFEKIWGALRLQHCLPPSPAQLLPGAHNVTTCLNQSGMLVYQESDVYLASIPCSYNMQHFKPGNAPDFKSCWNTGSSIQGPLL